MEILMGIKRWISRILGFDKEIEDLKLTVRKLTNELENYQHQIDYSFIPSDWKKVSDLDVVTNKTIQNGIKVQLDIRDLLNSTVYSRRWADQVIATVGDRKMGSLQEDPESLDSYFNRLVLEAANKTVTMINYRTNKSMFNVADRWNNGDCAIVTGEGDCDLSVRVFIRTLLDVLRKQKMFEYMKYVFQAIGYHGKTGHSWAIVFDPISETFKLIECTKDIAYNELPEVSDNYNMYFCLNFKNIYKLRQDWRIFL